MKILITSGGTKVPIDQVRDISNLSNGTFGAKIAKQFLLQGHEVVFFAARRSKSPFKFEFDFFKQGTSFDEFLGFCRKYESQFREFKFRNFSDYESGLWKLIEEENPDIVMLSAAVSDYGVEAIEGKVRSKDNLVINLHPLPKLISQIKERHPKVFLVGFKLLVNSTDHELLEAVKKSGRENQCDLVIGNDLRDIKNSQHKLLLSFKDTVESHESDPSNADYLASIVVQKTLTNKINFV